MSVTSHTSQEQRIPWKVRGRKKAGRSSISTCYRSTIDYYFTICTRTRNRLPFEVRWKGEKAPSNESNTFHDLTAREKIPSFEIKLGEKARKEDYQNMYKIISFFIIIIY
jgi:hypothetical protein